ncbi:hypothetical protein ABZ490_02045 [Streptomyces sp. NPDC005811]|uniref:hypothetical protein n=1 Tax=Streptomyces sp. NPDC005811 TaxID=3154565 RepID=UPI003403B27A
MTPTQRTATAWTLLLVLVVAGTSGCTRFLPEHPAPPPLGARFDGDTLVVKFPMCPTDEVRRVEVYDWDAAEDDSPVALWWASDPTVSTIREDGVVPLWTGEGFTHHIAPRPAATAATTLDVSYTAPDGNGVDGVLPLTEIERASLGEGEYWTSDGPRTATEIDARLDCGTGAPNS